MVKEYNDFMDVLKRSVKEIDEKYITITRHQADDVSRERAYCYELYHHIRNIMNSELPDYKYTLHGEIDKKGQKNITELAIKCLDKKYVVPDFILHIPGEPENLLVVEVKPSDCEEERAIDDIKKIEFFMEHVEYKYGLLLFFGHDEPAPKSIRSKGSLFVFWHNANTGELEELKEK